MANRESGRFRDRIPEIGGVGIKTEQPVRPPLPSIPGLAFDTSFDISELQNLGGQQVEVKPIADRIKPEGAGALKIDADLTKLDEGVRKIKARELSDKIRGWIEEAQQLIAQQQFRAALKLLEKALKVAPASPQVLFLKGYCLFGLGDYDSALEVLREARRHAGDPETFVLVAILEVACMRAGTQAVERQLRELVEKRQFNQALALIEGELRKFPLNIALIYHKCRLLLLLGRTAQSKQTALRALASLEGENAELFQELLAEITVKENERYLEAARTALRRGNPEGALQQLQTCRAALAGHEQYEAARSYATERLPRSFFGSLFQRDKPAPLTEASRQKVLLWLFAEELNAGVAALNGKHFDRAARSLEAAARIDSRCRIICFLHGLSIVKGFEHALKKKETAPDLDRAVASLDKASSLLGSASNDPLVGRHSESLRKLVTRYLSQLEEVARERARREEEVRPVNEVIQEFNNLMEGLQKHPISSIKELNRAEREFRDLRRRADSLRASRRKSEAAKILGQVIGAVDRNLKQVEEVKSEAKRRRASQPRPADASGPVAECAKLYVGLAQYVESNPVLDRQERERVRMMIDFLRQSVNRARNNARYGSTDWQLLEQLETAIDGLEHKL